MSFFKGDLYTCIWEFLAVECEGKNTRPGIRRPVGTEDPIQGPSNYCLNLVLPQTQGSWVPEVAKLEHSMPGIGTPAQFL